MTTPYRWNSCSINQYKIEDIPETLIGIMALIADEWSGDGHVEEGKPLEAILSSDEYSLAALIVSAGIYMEDRQREGTAAAFRTALREFMYSVYFPPDREGNRT